MTNQRNMHGSCHAAFFTSCLLVVTASCSGNQEKDSPFINFDYALNVPLDSVIESVDVIPLEIKNEHYPYGIDRVFADDDKIIVVDNKNIIFVYSEYGKYISDTSHRVGNGEGEYSTVTTVSYNRHNGNIEVATPLKLLTYDCDTNLINSIGLPTKNPRNKTDGLFFNYIFDISQNEHLLIPGAMFDDGKQIMKYDSKSGKIKGSVKYDDYIISDVTMQQDCFHELKTGEMLFFPPGMTRQILCIDPASLEITECYRIIYGKNGIDKADLDFGDEKEKMRDVAMTSMKTMPLKTLMTRDYLLFVTKDGDSLRHFHTIVWNTKTHNGYKIDAFKDGKLQLPVIDYADDTGIYCVLEGENINRINTIVDPAKIRMPASEIQEGTYVVLRYKLKDSL